MTKCSQDNCDRKTRSKGLCEMHYKRLIRHGSPDNYGKFTFYSSPDSKVREFVGKAVSSQSHECVIWPWGRNSSGYGRVNAGVKKFAHVLVCEILNGPRPSPGMHAAHKCGNGHLGCVSGNHLYWATPKQNAEDRVRHGTQVRIRGENNVNHRLTEEQVRTIKLRLSQGGTCKGLGREYGVSGTNISFIRDGKAWAWL